MADKEMLVSLNDVRALLDMADPTGQRHDPLLHALRQAIVRLPQLEGDEMASERLRYLRRVQEWEGERAALAYAADMQMWLDDSRKKLAIMGHVPSVVLTQAGDIRVGDDNG